jgi:hypothetical protein
MSVSPPGVSPNENDRFFEREIGARAYGFYRSAFERFNANGPRLSWHWAAFFASSAWFAYRRMYAYALINIVLWALPFLAYRLRHGAAAPDFVSVYGVLLGIGVFIVLPARAKAIYWSWLRRKQQRGGALAGEGTSTGPATRSGASNVYAMLPILAVQGALIWYVLAGQNEFVMRLRVGSAIDTTGDVQKSVADFYAANHRFPDGVEAERMRAGFVPGAASDVKSLAIQPSSGAIIITLQAKGLEGRAVALLPDTSGGQLKWTCGTVDVPDAWLPAACRPPESPGVSR